MDREGIGKLAGLLKAFSTLTWVMFMWIGTYVRIHQAFRISMAMNFVTCVLSLNRKKKKRRKEGGKHLFLGSERVTGRKARGLQMEKRGCRCQTFLSLLSGRKKQTSDVSFLLYKI